MYKHSRLALGLMGARDHNEKEALATIHQAVEQGITTMNTGDFYGAGTSERILGRALKEIPREKVFISVKFGVSMSPIAGLAARDCSPKALRNFIVYSLKRLGSDYIDIYEPARLDPDTPIEDTIEAMAGLVKAGIIRYIGLSEVELDTVERARAVHPIHSLEMDYSLLARQRAEEMLPRLRQMGIGVAAYGVLFHGLLSESPPEYALKGEEGARNQRRLQGLRAVAREAGIPLAQLAIAWAMARGEDILPIIGASRPDRLKDMIAAANLSPGEDLLKKLEAAARQE